MKKLKLSSCFIYKILLTFAACIMFVLTFVSCEKQEDSGTYSVYYMNKDKNQLIEKRVNVDDNSSTEIIVSELIDKMNTSSKSDDRLVIKPDYLGKPAISLSGTAVILDYEESYNNMDSITELLYRAAVVKTVTSVSGVDYVRFLVTGDDLTYKNGAVIGLMRGSDFVDDSLENGPVEWRTVTLYYANKTGDKLVKKREAIPYNKNVSIEKMVLEKLIEGPSDNSCYATLPQDVHILSISVSEGVCFVNLSLEFVEEMVNVKSEIPVYSIVNSLCALDNIKSVKILVSGDTDKAYRETLRLDSEFTPNTDIVE
ncbi:MAG: GerMN domain-containing protein [Lachnospira sp.]